ncbi:MAG: GIY-YIG nuclease family protein [Chloroflexota bacterium]|nr:MAG: hypothetical protein KatS3mg047_0398 [Bellilinea sp.]
MMIERFPESSGSYVLVFRMNNAVDLSVGRSGKFHFPTGVYFYCGSALGRGGVRGRLRHHLNPISFPHWHIDYLHLHREILEVIYSIGDEQMECRWTQFLLTQPSAFIPAAGFGASDCRKGCPAHLIGFSVSQISKILRNFTLAWNCQRLPME